MLSFH